MVDRGEHRIGDAERQQAIDMLRTHVGAGRLTLDEFSDLAGEVFAAQTYGDLDEVMRSLPPGLAPDPQASMPPAGGAAPGQPTGAGGAPAGSGAPVGRQVRSRRRFVAIMSGARMRGRWRAPARIWALAFWGGVHIDLREAEIEAGVVDITAWAMMGGVTVTVPPGVPVDVDGLVVMGGTHNRTSTEDPLPGAPLVRVHARGLWGGVHAATKRTRAQRAAARDRGEPTDEGFVPPLRPPDPLALARPVLDEVARSLPRFDGRTGVPVRRHRRHDSGPGRDRRDRDRDWRGGPPPMPDPPPAPHDPPVVPPSVDDSSAAAAPTHPTGTLTMLVTDITRSTALAERLGDHRWMGVLGDHNALVREQVARHGGTEIKAQGDGFLVVFSSARRAILAAVDVQRALARYRDTHPDTPIDVRIGLHTGEIVDVDGDVFGQNVVVAVRIADEAAPGEIVVSALTRDLTVSGGDLTFGPAEEVQLKGLSQPWRVHRVQWARERA